MDQIANCKCASLFCSWTSWTTRTGEPNAEVPEIRPWNQPRGPRWFNQFVTKLHPLFSGRRSLNQQPFKRVTFKSPSQKGHDRRIAIGLEKVHFLVSNMWPMNPPPNWWHLMNVTCEGRDVFTVSVCLVDVSFRYGSHWMIRFSCISCLDNRRPKMEEKWNCDWLPNRKNGEASMSINPWHTITPSKVSKLCGGCTLRIP